MALLLIKSLVWAGQLIQPSSSYYLSYNLAICMHQPQIKSCFVGILKTGKNDAELWSLPSAVSYVSI